MMYTGRQHVDHAETEAKLCPNFVARSASCPSWPPGARSSRSASVYWGSRRRSFTAGIAMTWEYERLGHAVQA